MQTLGLSSTSQPTDNIFKRLFWPSIENQYDVDLLGQQGFYVCVVVGGLSLLLLTVIGNPIIALLTASVFFLAGCGVRERSVAAAAMAFTLYLTNFLGGFVIGTVGNPLVPLFVLMLLLANVRATLMSRKWSAQPTDGTDFDVAERSTSGVMDRFANRLPAKIWPVGRYCFFPLAGVLLLLTVAGLIIMKRNAEAAPHGSATQTFEMK
jgi:hypothetical protein